MLSLFVPLPSGRDWQSVTHARLYVPRARGRPLTRRECVSRAVTPCVTSRVARVRAVERRTGRNLRTISHRLPVTVAGLVRTAARAGRPARRF